MAKLREGGRRKLTKELVEKAPTEKHSYLIWDVDPRQLALQVRKNGRKSYKVVYSHHGRPRWFHIGDASIALADARRIAKKVMLAVAEGADPAAEPQAQRGTDTFAELHHDYLEQHAKKKNKSWKQADALARLLVSCLGAV
jgi:hypothetical protein